MTTITILWLALLTHLPADAVSAFGWPQGPIETTGGWRFTHCAGPATAVSLVGDLNGWRPDAHPMAGPDRWGCWQTTVALDGGRHAYMFVVDGVSYVRPTRAPLYVDDGFGAQVGVLYVWSR